jgi:hypothetical protein
MKLENNKNSNVGIAPFGYDPRSKLPMTLKEKFEEIELDGSNTFLSESDSEKFEQIADDYAIEFAEWMLKRCLSPSNDGLYIDYDGDKSQVSIKQLLEIFKKEKGL